VVGAGQAHEVPQPGVRQVGPAERHPDTGQSSLIREDQEQRLEPRLELGLEGVQ